LTERELEVLPLLALGLPNKAVAQRLGISEHTVKFHVGAILSKLGAASRTEAVMIAARRGLLPL
jgi:DNA-binding NarL/FixJ family response regulator